MGEYSTVSAEAVGITPPNPIPPTNRDNPNNSGEGAIAAKPIVIEKSAKQHISVHLRPIRSVIVPTRIAPINIPNKA